MGGENRVYPTLAAVWNMRNVSAAFSIFFLSIYSAYILFFSLFPEILSLRFAAESFFNGALLMGMVIPVTGVVLTGIYVVLADKMDSEEHSG